MGRITGWIAALRRRDAWERDLRAELSQHVEARAADLVRSGLRPDAALRQARIELGSVEGYREEARAASGFRPIDELRQDARYALRGMRRNPLFVAVAAASIALGVGANTVVLGTVDALLLRPLRVPQADRIYLVEANFWSQLSYPNFRDLRARASSFSALAGYSLTPIALAADGRAEQVWGELVTGNYFELLGLRPAAGRFFTAIEDEREGAAPLAVVSHRLWLHRFAGDSGVIGRAIRLNGRPFTVVGVAPASFRGSEVLLSSDLFLPMSMQGTVQGSSLRESRDTWNTFVLGRLAPGVDRETAEAELASIAVALGREFPQANEGLELRLGRPGLFGRKGHGAVTGFAAGVVALALLVLVAACANLASLFSARVSDRGRELAIRLSIGAGRGRVARQLVTESILVSLLGGALGWVGARWILAGLSGWRPPGLPLQVDLIPDWRIFGVALLITILAGALAALAPTRLGTRVDLNRVLRGLPAGGRPGRRWTTREALLATQVGLAALLVATCLVSIRGLARALDLPTGLDAGRVGVAFFDLSARQSQAGKLAFQQRARDAVAALPGVSAAAYGSSVPLSIYQSHVSAFRHDDTRRRPTDAHPLTEYSVSPGYLGILGIRLVEGRDFTPADGLDRRKVAIVNRRFAATVLDPGPAVGQRFRGPDDGMFEVIGLVEDGRYENLAEAPRAVVFWPAPQSPSAPTFVLARSTTLPPRELARQMERAITALDPELPMSNVGSVEDLLGFAFLPSRVAAVALSAFGALAIALAFTGINGMAAYAVSQRTREIGIRVALGARPGAVLRLVFGRTTKVLALGSLAGLAVALAAGRLLSNVVVTAIPAEPIVLLGTGAAMVLAGCLAALVPARRATSIDPLRAVKAD
jgi:predicted permease